METKVGILAIGNEVVEGQITNRNAAWLSAQISNLGAQPLFHLSCRDEHDEIIQALNFLKTHCRLILISGGLGPTRDDCTRQCLSQWLGLPLNLDESEWTCIKRKLTDRQVTLREGHKRQAMIPENAVVLKNTTGIAPGFFVKADSCFVAALPGPPNELKPMYEDQLKNLLQEHLNPKLNLSLRTWVCLGAPESDVAHITESIMGDEWPIGYRLHKPFVEVKVWLPHQLDGALSERLNRLEVKLEPWLVGSSVKDIRENFHRYLKNYENVFVIDHLTSGLMLEKLKEGVWADHLRYQCFEHKAYRHFSRNEVQQILSHMGIQQNSKALFVSLFPESDNSALVSFNEEIFSFQLPRNIPLKSKFGQSYIIEKCFLNYPN